MRWWNAPTSCRRFEDGSLLAALSYLLTQCFIEDKITRSSGLENGRLHVTLGAVEQ